MQWHIPIILTKLNETELCILSICIVLQDWGKKIQIQMQKSKQYHSILLQNKLHKGNIYKNMKENKS